MAVYLLDTDIFSLYRRGHPRVTWAVVSRPLDLIVLCAVTVEEQTGGWSAKARSARTPADKAAASDLLALLVTGWGEFPVVAETVGAVTRADHLARQRLNVGRSDLRIAAVALDAGATLVTRNRRDFARVPNLALTDWAA